MPTIHIFRAGKPVEARPGKPSSPSTTSMERIIKAEFDLGEHVFALQEDEDGLVHHAAVSLPDDPGDPRYALWHFVQGILLKEALQKHERLLDEYEADVEDFV